MDAILKKFPRYVWICLAAVLGVQTVCYIFTEPFLDTSALHHLETAWDYQIPFRPEWVLVYLLCMPLGTVLPSISDHPAWTAHRLSFRNAGLPNDKTSYIPPELMRCDNKETDD